MVTALDAGRYHHYHLRLMLVKFFKSKGSDDTGSTNTTLPPTSPTSPSTVTIVFNVTGQGNNGGTNITVPPIEKNSTSGPGVWTFNLTEITNGTDPQGVSGDKNSIVSTTTTQQSTTETNDGFEEVRLGGDFHKSFMETEVETMNEDYGENEFYKDDLKNYGVNPDMFKSEEERDFLIPQRVRTASEESFDKQMGKKIKFHFTPFL